MRDHIPTISDSEWEVMKVLWDKHPLTANEIIDELADTKWKPKTVKTLINRLLKKGAIDYEKIDRAYAYYPVVDKKTCIRAESQSFLQRIYDGSLKPMLVHFLEDEKLSKEDIEELKALLEKRAKKR